MEKLVELRLRPYQKECIDAVPERGRFLIQMATGSGKTVCFSRIPRKGKVLILSHRDELVRQPIKYYDVPVGIEQGVNKSNGEEIVSASVQSLVRRLNRFTRDEFDMVIVDECHHASSPTYQKIIEHFNPRLLLGFTATPNRADGTGLDKIFDDIIFERDLEWGIKNGYLSDIYALRVDIGYDLRNVASKLGDYAQDELEKAVNIESANKAIADAYHKYAKGQTLIFAVSVEHAKNIAKAIPGAEYVVGGEKREETLKRFKEGKLRCLVNCMIFTEGTDLPNIETIIMARPTQSNVLYTQAVGRGTRLYPGKEELTLIDCVGASRLNLCTAPTLLGLDPQIMDDYDLPQAANIFDIPDMMERLMDEPKYWIRNAQIVDLWAKGRKYNLHGVNWFRTAKGYLVLGKPKVKLPPPDKLGRIFWNGKKVAYQRVLDEVYQSLCNNYADSRSLWDKKLANKWGEYRATDRQLSLVHNFLPGHSTEGMTKAEAGAIITRMFLGREL